MEFNAIIEKLSKINWASLNEGRNGFVSECGLWSVLYTVTIDQSRESENRFQVTIYVRYNNSPVISYGCDLVKQNVFGEWFLSQSYKIRDKEFEQKELNSLIGRKLF